MTSAAARRPARHSSAGVLVALAATLALAACGGSGSGSDSSKQITDTLTTGLTTSNPTVLCTKTFSTGFVKRVYGTQAKCVTVETKNAKTNKPATAVKVTGIAVDGGTATAVVAITGGDDGGASGPLSLVSQQKGWRVDDLSTALLRSQLDAGVKNDRSLPANLKTCIANKISAFDDPSFRSLAFGSIGDQPAALAQIKAIATDCFAQTSASTGTSGPSSGSASVLRKQFDQGISESLKKDGIPTAAITCVQQKLRRAISDKEIIALIGAGSKGAPPKLAQATAAAMAACNATK